MECEINIVIETVIETEHKLDNRVFDSTRREEPLRDLINIRHNNHNVENIVYERNDPESFTIYL